MRKPESRPPEHPETTEPPTGTVHHRLRRHHQRDGAADERDRTAERRDREADERDRAAEGRDRADGRSLLRDRERAAGYRELAARDRRLAARDRRLAAHDRRRAARDRRQAGLDGLTGALRRERGLIDLQREIDRARRSDGRLVLAFVDVDGLKTVNDDHGHAAGDQLLCDVAAALLNGLRSYDLVVRYGGDEFVCALPGTSLDGAKRRFHEVGRALAEKNLGASMSTGLAELADPDTLDDLTARADAALYAGRHDDCGQAAPQATRRFTTQSQHPDIG
jgi:diguanylate cyclase (GGDEF)-like protein